MTLTQWPWVRFQACGGYSEGTENDTDHANRSATLALDLADAAESALKDPTARRRPIKLKVGLHVGAVIAGFVGKIIPKFCLFGTALNLVSDNRSLVFWIGSSLVSDQ